MSEYGICITHRNNPLPLLISDEEMTRQAVRERRKLIYAHFYKKIKAQSQFTSSEGINYQKWSHNRL